MRFGVFKSAEERLFDRHLDEMARAILERALAPWPYRAGWVRDNIESRFEWSVLHAVLIIQALSGQGAREERVVKRLPDALFSLYDYGLRETGIGDASIARKARALGERFAGLSRALLRVINEGESDDTLCDVLRRNGIAQGHEEKVAQYIRRQARALVDVETAKLIEETRAHWVAFEIDPSGDAL